MKDCLPFLRFSPFQTLFFAHFGSEFLEHLYASIRESNPKYVSRDYLAYALAGTAARAFAAASICSRVMISVAHRACSYASSGYQRLRSMRYNLRVQEPLAPLRRGFFGLQNKLVKAARR